MYAMLLWPSLHNVNHYTKWFINFNTGVVSLPDVTSCNKIINRKK